MPSKSSSPS
uniref:Uncharacterized protein n=1 Tax=Arundo donax TaxID=35708 RepID=A0A0A9A300_ARUDO